MRSERSHEQRERFEQSTQQFRQAHADGMRSLRDGDLDSFAQAIAAERQAIEQAAEAVESAAIERGSATAVNAEYDHLRTRMKDLEREHRALGSDSQNLEGQREHRARLELQISELQSHLKRLRDESR